MIKSERYCVVVVNHNGKEVGRYEPKELAVALKDADKIRKQGKWKQVYVEEAVTVKHLPRLVEGK
jgi:hypothetical protein